MSASDASVAGPRRVALLAREGRARAQLTQALQASGAQLVLAADPNGLDAATFRASAPDTVLVALEPAVEDSVFLLDAVLHDPALNVIFDDAELAAQREGWDAQRWARHLSAKLFGHGDVLPPGREADDPQIQPGLPPTPAQLHANDSLDPHLRQAHAARATVPTDGLGLLSSGALSLAPLELEDTADSFKGAPAGPGPNRDFSPTLALVEEDPPAPASDAFSIEPENWVPQTRPELDLVDGFGAPAFDEPGRPAAVPPPLPPLAAAEPVAPPPSAATRAPLVLELEALQGTSAGPTVRGAVVLMAGIGGPDAVRRVLGSLPADLPRPVLVRLRLDGGRYDNLVKQIARVAEMPVELAVPGEHAAAGHVYVVGDDVEVAVVEGAVRFAAGATSHATLLATLPAAESAVLMLSGADAADVGPALALGRQGAYVAGQAPQGCYDPAASRALQGRGGATGTPEDLAAELITHLYG